MAASVSALSLALAAGLTIVVRPAARATTQQITTTGAPVDPAAR
ncbi:hypothetical protein [Gandjariella thermophila]|uniref:Uncharacterized protein n=1 Tax=Gandjariella thermophila TaxID=1931992 RepID=A0A4D4JCI2_9PSEU|nr:hypothetical protein [Gandjariella thermophila]GDY32368.1 hypothetical protein GTS_40010 [Gandjariella thermophila]